MVSSVNQNCLVIGWAMGHWLTMELAKQALTMALTNQDPLAELLRHSSLGRQYAATRHQLLLTTHGITIKRSEGTAVTTPVLKASSRRSSMNSFIIGTTPPVKTRN
jgi:transposase InsO family protein